MLLKQIYFCRMYLLKQFHLQYSCMCLQDIHETLCISVRINTFRICTITISVSISTNIIFYPKINWIFNFWFQLRWYQLSQYFFLLLLNLSWLSLHFANKSDIGYRTNDTVNFFNTYIILYNLYLSFFVYVYIV